MKALVGIFIVVIIVSIGFMLIRQPNKSESLDKVKTVSPTTMNQTSTKQYSSPPDMVIDTNKSYRATIKTNKGDMNIELFATESPKTVNNFIFLSREGFYDNTPFHRAIRDFMIQGGDPTGTGTGGPGYRFADESITRDYKRGTLAMANAGPNTNGSQFFIMHKDSNTLPKDYVIFGQIVADDNSYKTLDALLETPVTVGMSGERSKPTEDLRITQITITEE